MTEGNHAATFYSCLSPLLGYISFTATDCLTVMLFQQMVRKGHFLKKITVLLNFYRFFTIFHAIPKRSGLRMNKIYTTSILMFSVFSITTSLQVQVGLKATGANLYTQDNTLEYAFEKVNTNTPTVLFNQITKQN